MLATRSVACPYCGEPFETEVDVSAGAQTYTEDCPVCCRPIGFRSFVDAQGELSDLELRREDD